MIEVCSSTRNSEDFHKRYADPDTMYLYHSLSHCLLFELHHKKQGLAINDCMYGLW
jgi:hypothetical protein